MANVPASKSVTGPTPPRPSRSASHDDSTSSPTGVTIPIPVTTTRLPARSTIDSPKLKAFVTSSYCRCIYNITDTLGRLLRCQSRVSDIGRAEPEFLGDPPQPSHAGLADQARGLRLRRLPVRV